MASRSLGTLTLDLVARIGGFQEGMDKASRSAGKRMREIERTAKQIGTAIGVALVGAGTAFAAMAKRSIDAADELSKTSQRIGISTEALSGLKFAAELADVQFEELTKGIGRLSRNAKDAAQGLSAPARAFEQLGVAFKNTDGTLRSTEELLGDVADKFSTLSDGTAKAALAQELFGRAGLKLVPLLNEGRGGIEAMRKEAERLGLVISTETGVAAEEFNDNLTRLKGAITGVVNGFMRDALPALNALTGQMVQTSQDSDRLSQSVNVLAGAFKALVVSGALVKNALEATGQVIGGMLAAFAALGRQNDEGFFDTAGLKRAGVILNETFSDAGKEADDFSDTLTALYDKLANPPSAKVPLSARGEDLVITDPKAGKEVDALKKAQESALQSILNMNQGLQQQIDTFGQSEAHVLQYRLTVGDLKKDVDLAGSAGQGLAQSIVANAEALEKLNKQAEAMKAARGELDGIQNEVAAIFDENLDPLERINQTFEAKKAALLELAVLEPALKEEVDQTLIALEEAHQLQLTELANEGHAQRLEDEREALEQQLELLEEFTGLRADTLGKLIKFDQQTQLDQLQTVAQVGAQIFGLLGAHSKKAFKLQKTFAIVEAIISTHKGIAKALELPWPLNFVVAGLVAAKGFAQVQAIRSAEPGGSITRSSLGGAGGSGGFGTTTPEGDPVDNRQGSTQRVAITLQGDNFSGAGVRALIEQLNEAIGDGVALQVTGA